MENLTPPANGKNAPDGAPPAQPVTRWNVASWNRCARISASASSPAPEREQTATAHDMHRDAPGAADRTASADRRPEQQRTTRRRPGLFLLPCLHACPACRISSPARAGCCAAPGKSWKVPGERWAQYPDITPTACTGKDQHRQRRTDDPAAHQLHRLPIAHRQQPAAPDLTAASASRLHLPAAPAHPAALPPACRSGSAPPTTAKRPKTSPPRPAAGGVRFFT